MSECECSSVIPSRRRYPQDEEDALQSGPRKKPYVRSGVKILFQQWIIVVRCHTDPLIHHGRHFGRVEHALCHLRTLLTNGVHRLRHLELLDENLHGHHGAKYV
jgi:hypothetical protein